MPPINEKPIEIKTKSEFEEAYKAGVIHGKDAADAEQKLIVLEENGRPLILTRDSTGSVIISDLEQYLVNPTRIKRHLILTDVDSFTRYVNEFKDIGTRIYGEATLTSAKFRAILDDEISNPSTDGENSHKARNGEHIAEYHFPSTPEWIEILANNGKAMLQLKFAEMVERLALNFLVPNGTDMLELARNLEGKVEGEFKASMDTDNGDRVLLFTQKTDAVGGARAEKIPIPNRLTLIVQPFVRGEHYQIEAIFRYRVNQGQVTFQYELVKPHEFLDKAVEQVRAQIELDTLIKPLFGNA